LISEDEIKKNLKTLKKKTKSTYVNLTNSRPRIMIEERKGKKKKLKAQ
jgi:hypothetical protein